jgi:hypothetical protein
MNSFLAIAGPAGWTALIIRAWRRGRQLNVMLDDVRQLNDKTQRTNQQSRERLAKANAELMYVRMLRHYHERQASTCHSAAYKGTEAPV